MTRKELMQNCPEGFEDGMKDIIDYFEGQFVAIREQLEIENLSQLNHIEEAYIMAAKIADDLY